MATRLGEGDYVYEEFGDWAKLPEGWSFREVADVVVDAQDRVYVFNRGEHPMIVFAPDGQMVASWGEGVFVRPHGVTLGPDETLYCVDDRGAVHTQIHAGWSAAHDDRHARAGRTAFIAVFLSTCPPKWPSTPKPGTSTSPMAMAMPGCTSTPPTAVTSFRGANLAPLPGQFNLVHSVCLDGEGKVYVADRENHRVQIFAPDGDLSRAVEQLHRPCGLYIQGNLAIIGQLPTHLAVNAEYPNIGACVTIHDLTGPPLGQAGRRAPRRTARGIHGSPWLGRRFAGRPVCGRSLLERLWQQATTTPTRALLPQAG